MRRPIAAVLAGVLLALTFTAPAQATAPGGGWERLPAPPFDLQAGVNCDFAVHGEPVVDEVYVKTLTTHPDGTPRTQAAAGPLVYRITNAATGAATRGNASSSALMTTHADGSRTWLLSGPLVLRFRGDNGNLPRGLYNLDGAAWRLDIGAGGHLTVSGGYRIVKDICATLG